MQMFIVAISITSCALSHGWHVQASAPTQSDQFAESDQVSYKEKSEVQGSEETSLLQVKGEHKPLDDTKVSYDYLGEGSCKTADGHSPHTYAKGWAWRAEDGEWPDEESCKSHCTSFTWCAGISISKSYCDLHIADGENPSPPSGWHMVTNNCGKCGGSIDYAVWHPLYDFSPESARHCYRKVTPLLPPHVSDPCNRNYFGGKPEWHTCEKDCTKDTECGGGGGTCEAGKCRSRWGGWCADDSEVCEWQPIRDSGDPCSYIFQKTDWRSCEIPSCNGERFFTDCPKNDNSLVFATEPVCIQGKCVPKDDRLGLSFNSGRFFRWCADQAGSGLCALQRTTL